MAKNAKVMLIVEDELLVRMCAAEFAEEAGFAVIEASDVDSAVEALERNPEISTVLTDVNLPGSRDGLHLARHVEMTKPSVRVIVASGKPIPASAGLSPEVLYLAKPYGEVQFMAVIDGS